MKIALALIALAALAPTTLRAQVEVQLRRADGGSIAGAQARWRNADSSDASRQCVDLDQLDANLRVFGSELSLDASGRGRTSDGLDVLVVAWLHGWWGVARGSGLVTVTLRPDRPLLVEVVGRGGEPYIGGRVSLFAEPLEDESPLEACVGQTALGSNVHRFAFIESLRAEHFDARALRVQLETFPRSAGATARVPERIADEPIVLTAMNLPRLRVEAVDEDGKRVNQGFEAALVCDPMTAWDTTRPSPIVVRAWHSLDAAGLGSDESVRAAMHDGVADFERVDVEAGLLAFVRRNALSDWNGRVVSLRATNESPRVPLRLGEGCESVVLTLKLGDEVLSTGSVRVRRAISTYARARLSRASLAADSDWHGLWAEDRVTKNDADWTEWVDLLPADLRIDMVTAERANGGLIALTTTTRDGKRRFALVDVRRRERQPEHIIEVDLTDADRSVNGKVVDHRGRAVHHAEVRLEMARSPWTNALVSRDEAWIGVWRSETDSNGRFELPTPQHGLLRIVAIAPDRSGDLLRGPVVAGDDLVLVLAGRGDLRGTLRASGPLGSADLNILLLRYAIADNEPPAAGYSLGCSCDGAFEFTNAKAGRYTLIVRRACSGAAPIELLRRDGIEIESGQVLDLGELRVE